MTQEQKDILVSCMFLANHMSERYLSEVQKEYEAQMRVSKNYQLVKKKHGIAAARLQAQQASHQVLFGAEVSNISEILKCFDRIKYLMQRQTDLATGGNDGMMNQLKDGVTQYDMSESLLADTDFFCRIILLISDLRHTLSDIQIESLLKLHSRNGQYATELIPIFNKN